MKRAQVNAIIKEALDFAGQMNFKLPPFAYWKWEDYLRKGKEEEYREFFDNMLGWDVTDFGHGNFEKCGLYRRDHRADRRGSGRSSQRAC